MRAHLATIAATFGVAVAPAVAEAPPAGGTKSPFLAGVGDNLYYTPSNCCGLVAAYLVIGEFRGPVPLRDLAAEVPVTPAGTPMNGLIDVFDRHGLDAVGMEATADELRGILSSDRRLIAVALITDNHWVTVRGVDDDGFDCFNYPRREVVAHDRFAQVYSNKVVVVGPEAGSVGHLRGDGRAGAGLRLLPWAAGAAGAVAVAALAVRRVRRGIRAGTAGG